MLKEASARSVRALPWLLACILFAGCAASGNSVFVSNRSDAPASFSVEVRDAGAREVAFDHDFGELAPSGTASMDHRFEQGRTYVVNATVVAAGETIQGERRIDTIPTGGWIDVTLGPRRTLEIMVGVAD